MSIAQGGQGLKGRLENVPPILRMAILKMPVLRYSGTRSVEIQEGPNRERHIEYVLRDGPRTRTWFPNDSPYAGQVIVEARDDRLHYVPGKNEIHVGPARREEAFQRLLGLLKRNILKFNTSDGGQVAGHATTLVSASDNGNPVQKLWIDRSTGMVLRRELYDMVGAKVGAYEFSEIDYTPTIAPDAFTMTRKGARTVTSYDEARDLARINGFQVAILPESESYRLETTRVLKNARIPILHQTYGRPGAMISLFQARGTVDLPMLKRPRKGDTESFTWGMGGNTFALIGNVPADELRRLARVLGLK